MIIIGEKINATRKAVKAAIEARDEKHIIELAVSQAACGADYIDVNGGDPREGMEVKNMEWLVTLVQANTDKPIAIDSANPDAIRAGLKLAKVRPILNSISLEAGRLENLLPIVAESDCRIVALCMADGGTPTGADDRVEWAKRLVDKLVGVGKNVDDIIVDPCFFPISANQADGKAVCDAIARIRREIPGVHVGGGVSNSSFGLPARKLINFAMITNAIFSGMDTAIVDPCLPGMMQTIWSAEVVSGADEWCANYIGAHREGKLL
jgi:5-methyltetrahydrofolate--homocysteine methyltransferase